MRKKKTNNYKHNSSNNNTYYTKISKVHLATNGIITICKITTIDGSEDYFQWDIKINRDMIRNSVIPEVEIIVDKNVTKGWDYDG